MNTRLREGTDIKRSIAIAAALSLALGLSACGGGGGGGNGPGSKQLDLVIGNSLPLSGISKDLGESGEKASDLAVDRIKQAIEDADADHTIRVVSEDQGSDPDAVKESATKLIKGDGASCLTGPWSSDALDETAQDVVIPSKVLQIVPIPTGADVSDLNDHDLVNSTALPESVVGAALSKAIDQDLGGAQGHSVNVASTNDTYGSTLSQDFIDDWQGKDGSLSGLIGLASPSSTPAPSAAGATSNSYSGGTSSSSEGTSSTYSGDTSSSGFSQEAQNITTGSPDAIVLIDSLQGFAQLAPDLSSSYSWDPSIAWGSDQLASPGLPGEVGADAIDGMRALAPGVPQDDAASTAFVDDFKAADPRDVKQAPLAAQEFDATVLCYLAAVAAGSTDGQEMADHLIDITAPGGDQFTWQQLPDAIKALEDGKDIDYTGASGPIDMDVHGDPTAGVFDIYRYSGDRLEVAGEVPVEKPNPATP
jgi:ABC-type branched-subunit amino acid transport system substrate-binding protein